MPVIYNGQKVKKIVYNGQGVSKLNYNGQDVPLETTYVWEQAEYLIAYPGNEDQGIYLRRDTNNALNIKLEPVTQPPSCDTPYSLYFSAEDQKFKTTAPSGVMIRNGKCYLWNENYDFSISLDPNDPLGLGCRDFAAEGCTGSETDGITFGLRFDPETGTFSGESHYQNKIIMKAEDGGFRFYYRPDSGDDIVMSDVIRLVEE